MMQSLRHRIKVYGAFAEMAPKDYFAYTAWVWVEFIAQFLTMTIFVHFWRAVYASTSTLNGLDLQQTLNYILLAQVLAPLVQTRTIFQFGFLIQTGQLVVELLRPVDFQARVLVDTIAWLGMYALQKIPLLLIAVILFGLQLPTSPAVWLAFGILLILGRAVVFYFDWIFACLAFYTTETWGLSVVRIGVATFFSGVLIPIAMMPGWLQQLASALPFAQAIYMPTSLLSGITSLADAPRVLLVQLGWLIALAILSRGIFNVAVRKVTVQGG